MSDLRFTFRQLLKNPGFTAVAVFTLALGIGATSAIFSLFDAIVLRELPAREPGRLVFLSQQMPGLGPNSYLSYPHFARVRDTATTIDGILAMTPRQLGLEYKGQSELVQGLCVSGAYHTTLGLRPALGRLLGNQDDTPSGEAAVISYAYWQRRFGLSPSILGEGISVNGVPFTIVGVEPRGFVGIEVGSA